MGAPQKAVLTDDQKKALQEEYNALKAVNEEKLKALAEKYSLTTDELLANIHL